MGTQRYTINRGQTAQNVVQAAGSALGTDIIQVNIDFTAMTRGEAVLLLEQIREAILERNWPPA